jgi:hypothetical protein
MHPCNRERGGIASGGSLRSGFFSENSISFTSRPVSCVNVLLMTGDQDVINFVPDFFYRFQIF